MPQGDKAFLHYIPTPSGTELSAVFTYHLNQAELNVLTFHYHNLEQRKIKSLVYLLINLITKQNS